ncbi:MAG: hypothetical protein WCC04_04720 [Terriglobales bacterium]
MAFSRVVFCPVLLLACAALMSAQGQESTPANSQDVPMPRLSPGSEHKPAAAASVQPVSPQVVALTVPKQVSFEVALEKEVRVKKVGQSISARLMDPIYAFDKLVVPTGAEVHGRVTKIEPLSNASRTLAGLDADFTPVHNVEVTFTDLTLPDGKHLSLHTSVTPGSGHVMQFVSGAEKDPRKSVKDVASEKTKEAKQQAHDEWNNAMKQLKTPGRMHRLERYAEAQLPVHAQYIPAGTIYFAELEDPLDFGNETLPDDKAALIGGPLPEGSVVHARLLTALSSATAQKGEQVEAVLSRPLFDGERLVYPQGSRLLGSVGQVQPARRLKKNGQLRIAFHQVVLPDGIEQKVQAALVGVQASKDGNVKLDSEGGAEATNSKTRYASVSLALGLAALGSSDRDGDGGGPGVTAGNSRGFRLVGIATNALARSRAFGYATGAYGAGRSLYLNFLTRGHEVVFPKNTAMDIGIGTRSAANEPPVSSQLPSPISGVGQ